MKSGTFSNIMTLFPPLIAGVIIFLAQDINAACCNVGCMPRPCQPWYARFGSSDNHQD